MKADQKSVLRNIVIILIFFSLTTIFGCKWGSWSFDLFASTPNGDETANLSGSFAEDEDGDVLFFEWVP
jgi:hypothetical protein